VNLGVWSLALYQHEATDTRRSRVSELLQDRLLSTGQDRAQLCDDLQQADNIGQQRGAVHPGALRKSDFEE
jgi:hypothetical protein